MERKNLYLINTESNGFKIRLSKPKSTFKLDKYKNSIISQDISNNDFLKSMSFNRSQKFKTPTKENENSNYFQSDLKSNECIMGDKCPYYKKYQNLKSDIKLIVTSNNQTNYFNESLYNSLLQKTNLYQLLIDENEQLKKSVYKLSAKKYLNNLSPGRNKKFLYSTDEEKKYGQLLTYNQNKSKYLKMTLRNFKKMINNRNKDNFETSDVDNILMKIKTGKNHLMPNNQKNISKIRNSTMINNCDPKIHYELLNDYTSQQNRKNIYDRNTFSFLSPNINYDAIIKKNISLNLLINLTKNDREFLSIVNNTTQENFLKYKDHITSLINDYQEIVKLGMRMKNYIKCSINFEESIIEGNSIKTLIETTCKILECDRASLFILDKNSDKLVFYSGEGLKKAQIKVPKDKGVIGSCFMKNKVIRINDVYLDDRFNRDIDKATNYKTKSILCHPLIDKNGECFGVYEAINKKNSKFSEDDEELLKFLSHQACIIFKNMNFIDDNKYLVWNLMNIVDYNICLNDINNKVEFTEKTEEFLMDIFCCISAKFFFVEKNKIIHYSNKNIENFENNIGIVGKVIKLKNILGYENISDSVEYNSFIDLDSCGGLLTFPILEKKTKEVKGVVQVPYIGKISKNGKPKDSEMKLIKKLKKCIKYWIERNTEKQT